jgi:pimeloyl-ACP methyl ester carboxylesterase
LLDVAPLVLALLGRLDVGDRLAYHCPGMSGDVRRPLVLVPGACLGGWVWRDVATILRSRGHDVHQVTLTGLGERVDLVHEGVDLETRVTDVVNRLDYENREDAVLVGHSYTGIVITGVADRRPRRLNAAVYLDTSPLPNYSARLGTSTIPTASSGSAASPTWPRAARACGPSMADRCGPRTGTRRTRR